MSEQPEELEEEESKDKEMLVKAINLLKRFTTGYKLSNKCVCPTCAAGKFLNEIV